MHTSKNTLFSDDNHKQAHFAVIYRWRLHKGKEHEFVTAWTRISELFYLHHGSLGSRLHRGSDGIWYSYAQWPDAEARTLAFNAPSVDPEASVLIKTCIAESFPEIVLDPVSDLLTCHLHARPD
ncbi:antibiotic biosynthesis monooxygenase [Undibacterium oligocarboniphilum]|uniref:Antibiotic biosynthesis monooxygenase n=1 Tax=Undibacterium oligocarboniphilum TaxID=666702 RepID=A0A850QCJ6_9BURK|nr:antibiotic biosynthesis monooxygenase [Undibacterium oligocarboniphilum]NVO76547.1 antibiotic biosynthesis monooxygenase [Undibacterium oligocarboniphilum]